MNRIRAALVLGSCFFIASGCGRSGPSEISVADSGIEVVATPLDWGKSDWPQWRGTHGDGVVDDRELPTRWSDTDGIAWSRDLPGRGHSSPVVMKGSVFLTTALESDQRQLVIALDATTGEIQWEKTIHQGAFPPKGEMQHPKSSHANGTVACDGERVIATFFNGGKIMATALDLDGNQLWQQEAGSFRARFGYAASPILYGSVVIVAADQSGGGFIAALDRETGQVAWRTKRPSDFSYSSPLVATIDGRDQIVLCGCQQVIGYDPKTGDELWACRGTTSSTCGTPVTDGRHVFASGGHPGQNTLAVRVDGSAEEVWSNRTRLYEPSLVLTAGLLFGVTDNGIAYCWGPEDGAEHWKKRLSGEFSASPLAVNGLIYVSNLRGTTFVFQASAKGYEEVAKNRLGDEIFASPAVSGTSLFIRAVHQVDGRRVERLHRIDAVPVAAG